ncbi:GSU2403 family nucleotidyltransferase fold protein [Aquamicrobium sp. LC103]|uniref:nucleotidyltransferase family protein n=1 Tax=Aquamicrobium sp. LC103 TaxID=1120658 RepID=UPI001FEEF8BB|nr:GSU2403 family nucleotidyltransferase fold protein [Aquamicrobium sp. LC103]
MLEAHGNRAVSDLRGKPFTKKISGKTYWYSRRRVGAEKVERYIGPDSDELRNRIEKMRDDLEEEKDFERRCAVLVAQLRAAGMPTLDRQTGSILNAMARVGVFRLGGTLIGTHAFRLYGAELGCKFPGFVAVTEDVDVAAFENLKLAIHDQVDPSLAETFGELSLQPAPGLDPKGRPTRWTMKGGGTMVEFLAPRMQSKRDIVKLEPLSVYAQTLPFLNFLIADPIPAVALYRSGVLVQIPRPERYAIHKLIVAQRRSGSGLAKVAKDLAQAEALIEILLQDRPGELALAYEAARDNGAKWREAVAASMKQRPGIAKLLDQL